METKISITKKWAIAFTFGIALFFAHSFFLSFFERERQNAYLQGAVAAESTPVLVAGRLASTSSPVRSGPPVRLIIPTIKVDAVIESLGLTPDGVISVPEDPRSVAWYNLGARPGEVGNAVISGHYGWKDDTPAVFDSLRNVRESDKLYIEDEQGKLLTFVVREIKTYNTQENSSEVFTSTDGRKHLVLITCEGEWNKKAQSYANRLVVFADMEMATE